MPELKSTTENTREFLAGNFKNTELGLIRIAKKLDLRDMTDTEIIGYCRKIILATPEEKIEQRGKNYYLYCPEYLAILTINKSSLGIITAKRC